MSTESYLHKAHESVKMDRPSQRNAADRDETLRRMLPVQKLRLVSSSTTYLFRKNLSPWSSSQSKRTFDCFCVVSMLPLLLPIFLLVGLGVRLTSSGPVLFLQRRMGRNGRSFTILKFRTMEHAVRGAHQPVTTCGNQRFTPVGPFLRRWKLDEIPQLFNVLLGQMSLVGPRPKLPEHAISSLPCRPGITGAATIAFAREESILDRVPERDLENFYHEVVLPAKHRLDADYMANATFLSDLKLIVDSVLRRWDSAILESLLNSWAFGQGNRVQLSGNRESESSSARVPLVAQMDHRATPEEVRAL